MAWLPHEPHECLEGVCINSSRSVEEKVNQISCLTQIYNSVSIFEPNQMLAIKVTFTFFIIISPCCLKRTENLIAVTLNIFLCMMGMASEKRPMHAAKIP